ncbi:MAG: F0F1 ATP synthase subunit delta [Deltaproteobacteria bacterium]
MGILQLVFIQIVTFTIILLVLRFVSGSQLQAALKRLQDLHQENLEKEEILNKEIERARALSQGEITRSKEEAKRIMDNARKNAQRLDDDARAQAQIQMKKLLADAEEHARTLRAEAAAGAEVKAIDMARDLVAETFTARGAAAVHRELVAEFLDELEKVEGQRLRVPAEAGAQVSTARLLDEDQRRRLEAILEEKRGEKIPLRETEDPALVTGLVLNLGGLVVDGSLRNRLRKALEVMRRQRAAGARPPEKK